MTSICCPDELICHLFGKVHDPARPCLIEISPQWRIKYATANDDWIEELKGRGEVSLGVPRSRFLRVEKVIA